LFAIGTITLPKSEILIAMVVDAKTGNVAKINTDAKIDTNLKIGIDTKIDIN
jgi:hypothetical protein